MEENAITGSMVSSQGQVLAKASSFCVYQSTVQQHLGFAFVSITTFLVPFIPLCQSCLDAFVSSVSSCVRLWVLVGLERLSITGKTDHNGLGWAWKDWVFLLMLWI